MTFTTLIDASALRELAGKADIVVIDCRFDLIQREGGRRAYLAGHIPGARYADLNRDLSAPVSANSGRHPLPLPKDFAATLTKWGIGDATQVIAYDDAGGSFAARAWWMLRWLGHTSVAVLDGGMKAWTVAGGTLESGAEQPLPKAAPAGGRILAQANAAAVIDTANIAAFLSEPGNLLVDARAAERYAGSVEPIDAVAGHIAGAVNHPFSANLAPNGQFLPASELRRLWDARLAGREVAHVAAMCGSGVTACHNLLSLEVAGLPGAKLYAGSWSEWIKDPNRPIGRGA
ncbi:MAG: sulfurtransferase [Pseudomonadota bacterium]|nr:sulfurtransferase [Pseudomonadota bacterium]